MPKIYVEATAYTMTISTCPTAIAVKPRRAEKYWRMRVCEVSA